MSADLDMHAALTQARQLLTKMTRPAWCDRFRVDTPPGVSGPWRVEKFKVDAMGSMRTLSNPYPVPIGTYTRLVHTVSSEDGIVMSDTPAEMYQHLRFWKAARGRVLIAGLGLGMIATALLRKPEVENVLVLEKSADVIELVGWAIPDQLPAERKSAFRLQLADIHDYLAESDEKFDCCWLDIWPTISGDNLPEMLDLERTARQRVVRAGGLVMSWEREVVELLATPASSLSESHSAVLAVRRYRSETDAIVAELEAGTL